MNEYYHELILTTNSNLELFSDLLFLLTKSAIEEKDNKLILRDNDSLEDIKWALEEFAKRLNLKVDITLKKQKNEDWILKYQESIQPIEVASFYVRPKWHSQMDNKIDIIINPALAFGSGHHETTSSCLIAIDKYINSNMSVLDVGCGSGILAIAAAKKGATVDICDTDELAINSAKDNFEQNRISFRDAWVGSVNKSKNSYDFVIANIIADVILIIEKDLKHSVKQNGILTLSGIIGKYIHKIEDSFSEFKTLNKITKGEWHTLVLQKR